MNQREESTTSLIYSFLLRCLASPIFFAGWVLLAIISQSIPSILFAMICAAPVFFLSLIMMVRKDMRTAIQRVAHELGQPSMRDFLSIRKAAQRLNRYAVPHVLSQSGAAGRDITKATCTNNMRTDAASISSRQKSGARGDDDDSEPNRPINLQQLYDEHALAKCFSISKKTIQNLFSKSPHLFPPAINVPGARGPRWTARAIADWIDHLERKTISPRGAKQQINSTPRRPGRPRIARIGGAK